MKWIKGHMNPTDMPRLESAIRTAFAPLLREDGFKGSGQNFWKLLESGWLQLVNIQRNKYGGSFTVNLAINFYPGTAVAEASRSPIKFREYDCPFRRRLAVDPGDACWYYQKKSMNSMIDAVNTVAGMYADFGRGYFEAAIATLETMTVEMLSTNRYNLQGFDLFNPNIGLQLARIRRLQGKNDECRRFARHALKNLQGIEDHRFNREQLKSELEQLASI